MKTPSKIFIGVVILLAFLVSLAWLGVRHVAHLMNELDHVTQVDLVLMEAATDLKAIQLEKEIIFAKLSASAEELAFGQVNPARLEYLQDYLKGLDDQFKHYAKLTERLIVQVQALPGVSADLKSSFVQMHTQALSYDEKVKAIFKAVTRGGFQLSLDDLEQTDSRQKILSENAQEIVTAVWQMVHESKNKSQQWRHESKLIFWFSLLLTATLLLLLFAFKKNLEEISQQKKDLEKLNQELDRFVHTVSHDIAGPLTTIVGYAAYLETHYLGRVDQKGQDCISGVRKGAGRMNILVKDMLALTKISRIKNPYERISLSDVLEAARANLDFLIKQNHVEIIIPEPLPTLVCDRIKMTAIFFNLLSNAIKFAKQDLPPQITISWTQTHDTYEFRFQDNGIGIDPLHHKDIFDMFKRLHGAEKYVGSGIGLSIVKLAVEDQGGRVRVQSNLGQGSTFIINIPKSLTVSKTSFNRLKVFI